MDLEDNQRLKELCKQASDERDSVRLMALVKEINALLDKKEPPAPKPLPAA